MPPPPRAIAPYPELVRVHAAAAAGDWAGLRSAYAALVTGPLRLAAVRAVGDVKDSAAMLGPVAEAPGDGAEQLLARTMLAANHIKTGWDIRTGYRAKDVSAEQFRQFHQYLRKAEQLLIDVIAHRPDTVPAWGLRLITARGLELGLSEARRRYDQCARYEPHLHGAQSQLLQQLCPKWDGSLEAMHGFARECAQAAPPGSLNPVLLVEAHLEHWAALEGREAAEYLRSAAVQQEIALAAGQSVLNPAFVPGYGWVYAHGYFALIHSTAGNPAAAAVHFRAIGQHDASGPWEYYYGDAEATYRQHRATALAKG